MKWLHYVVPAAALLLLAARPVAAADALYEVTGTKVNIRQGPASDQEIVAAVSHGDILTVIRVTGDWAEIRPPKGMSFWVQSEFVKDRRVTANAVKVRTGPSLRDPVAGKIAAGDEVTIRAQTDEWVQIAPPATLSLWINRPFIAPCTGSAAVAAAAAAVAAPVVEEADADVVAMDNTVETSPAVESPPDPSLAKRVAVDPDRPAEEAAPPSRDVRATPAATVTPPAHGPAETTTVRTPPPIPAARGPSETPPEHAPVVTTTVRSSPPIPAVRGPAETPPVRAPAVTTTVRTPSSVAGGRTPPGATVHPPPVSTTVHLPPVTTTVRTPTVTPIPRPLPEIAPERVAPKYEPAPGELASVAARHDGARDEFSAGRPAATGRDRTLVDYDRGLSSAAEPSAASTRYEGILEEAGFALLRPSRYRLVRHVNGRAVTICYVVYDESTLQSLLGSEVEVAGQEYLVQGLRHHVLEATQVSRK